MLVVKLSKSYDLREKVAGGWRRLHNVELHNLYTWQNVVRVIKWRGMWWVGHTAYMGKIRNVHTTLVGKPEGKRPLRRYRHT